MNLNTVFLTRFAGSPGEQSVGFTGTSVHKIHMANFISHDRSQALVLRHDLREWAPEDDPCHFIIEAVERIPIGAFKINWKGMGRARHPPRMMLALSIYCSTNGMFSSRRIGKVVFRDVAVRFVAADTHPDHDTVAAFAAPMARAEAADEAGAERLPREVARREALKAKRDAARAHLEAGWRKRMRETMRTEAAREKYKRRKCTVEPVFGILRNVLGFNRFHLGGIESVKAEGLLVALADNCKRLCNLNAAKAAAA